MKKLHNTSGFTLVELMITVAILLMIVSIAMPTFQRLRLGARESEARANLNAIKTCQETYKAEHDIYLTCNPSPDDIPPTGGSMWDDNGGFEEIGFNPGNKIRYQYTVNIPALSQFTATAVGDVDGNGENSILQITHDTNIIKVSPKDVF